MLSVVVPSTRTDRLLIPTSTVGHCVETNDADSQWEASQEYNYTKYSEETSISSTGAVTIAPPAQTPSPTSTHSDATTDQRSPSPSITHPDRPSLWQDRPPLWSAEQRKNYYTQKNIRSTVRHEASLMPLSASRTVSMLVLGMNLDDDPTELRLYPSSLWDDPIDWANVYGSTHSHTSAALQSSSNERCWSVTRRAPAAQRVYVFDSDWALANLA